MISTSILKNGLSSTTYINELDMGITEMYYDGVLLTGSEKNIDLTSSKKMIIKLKTTKLKKINRIESVKITILPIVWSYTNPIRLSLETGINSNTLNYIGDFWEDGTSGTYSVDIKDLVLDNETDTFYLGISTEGSYLLSVYSYYKPRMSVDYIDEYHSIKNRQTIDGNVGSKITYKTNLRYGELLVDKQLYSFNGCRSPLNLSLVYNNLESDKVLQEGLPKGWKFNYFQKLIINSDFVTYVDFEGMKHTFIEDLENVYHDKTGLGLSLGKGYTFGVYCYSISDGKGKTMTFDLDGYLTSVAITKGQSTMITTLTYDSNKNLIKITDSMGNEVNITYLASQIILSKIGYPSITLNLSDNKLTSVNELNGRTTLFMYEGDLLNKVSVDSDEETSFTNDNKGRVVSILDSVIKENVTSILEKRDIEYIDNKTIITNYHNKTFEYIFNNDGEVISYQEVITTHTAKAKTLAKDGLTTSYFNQKNTKEFFLDSGSVEIKQSDKDSNGNKVTSKSVIIPKTSTENSYFEPDREYMAIIRYTMENIKDALSTDAASYFLVTQNKVDESGELVEQTIGGVRLDLNTIGEQIAACVFKTLPNNTNELNFKLSLHNTTGKVTIKPVGIEKYYKNNRYVCFNYPDKEQTGFNCENVYWYPKKDPYTEVKYIDSTGATLSTNLFLYETDMEENIKNGIFSNQSPYRFWYNKKRQVLNRVKNVQIKFGNTYYPLEDIKMCIVNEMFDKTIFTYYDYSSSGSVTNILRTEYQKIIYKENVYENYQIINKHYMPLKIYNYDKTFKLYNYDRYGNIVSEELCSTESPLKLIHNYTYQDSKYLITKEILDENQSAITTYEYNDLGFVNKVTLPNGLVEEYHYDPSSLDLIKITFSDGEQVIENNITYQQDLLTKMSHKNNIGYDFTYDNYNIMSSVKSDYNGVINDMFTHETSITQTFDEYVKIWASGYKEKVYVDQYGNVVQKSHYDSETAQFVSDKEYYFSDETYLEAGMASNPMDSHLKKSKDSKVKYEKDKVTGNYNLYFYNTKNNVEGVERRSDSGNSSTEITYDEYDRVVNQTYVGRPLRTESTYVYKNGGLDPSNEVEKVIVEVGNRMGDTEVVDTFEYEQELDHLNRLLSDITTLNNYSVKSTNSYLVSNINTTTLLPSTVTYIKQTSDGQPISTISNMSYTYDIMDNITSITDTLTNNNTNYKYDLFGRLIREDNQKLNKSVKYTYDDKGNILKKEIGQYSTLEDFVVSETINYGYSTEYPDRLTSYNGQPVTYDLNGNITAVGWDLFTWGKGRELLMSRRDYRTDYTHDGDGRVTRRKILSGTEHVYTYEGKKIVMEIFTDSSNGAYYRLGYVYAGDEVIGFTCNAVGYLFIKNNQRDIIGIVDESGNVVAKYVYDAWGNHAVYDGNDVLNTDLHFIGNINPFRYRGYYYEVETGLFMVGHRYYNPEWGRWLSPDDIEYLDPESINGLNLYVYCGNDPVNKYDPTGHFAITIGSLLFGMLISAAIGASIGVGATVVSDYLDDNQIFNGSITINDYIANAAGGFVAGLGIGAAVVLGGGVGAAALAGEGLTLFGTGISFGTAFALGLGASAATGGLGYLTRVGISEKETFNWSQLGKEVAINTVSGALSFTAAMTSGFLGFRGNVKLNMWQKGLRGLAEGYFIWPAKFGFSILK